MDRFDDTVNGLAFARESKTKVKLICIDILIIQKCSPLEYAVYFVHAMFKIYLCNENISLVLPFKHIIECIKSVYCICHLMYILYCFVVIICIYNVNFVTV